MYLSLSLLSTECIFWSLRHFQKFKCFIGSMEAINVLCICSSSDISLALEGDWTILTVREHMWFEKCHHWHYFPCFEFWLFTPSFSWVSWHLPYCVLWQRSADIITPLSFTCSFWSILWSCILYTVSVKFFILSISK